LIDPALPSGHPLALVADHFPISLSEGGPTIPANLKAAHSLYNSSHKGLGTPPKETVEALIAAGLLRGPDNRHGMYSITSEGRQAFANWKRDGNPLALTLISAINFPWPPHWWHEITETERALATEIMKLPLGQDGAVLPPK
jgi:hypothetical protein